MVKFAVLCTIFILKLAVPVHEVYAATSLDCLCLNTEYQVKGDADNFTIPTKTCVEVIDIVSGLHDDTWYHVNYTSQLGWIQLDKSVMKIVICGRKELSKHICIDVILNCHQYNRSTPNVCHKYPDWSKDNCRKFCGLCDLPCLDLIDNCNLYGPAVCKRFFHWSGKNCKNYCKLCDPDTKSTPPIRQSTQTVTSSSLQCVDKPGYDCQFFMDYGLCNDPASAKSVCPKFCKIPGCE
ncbi:hypothetical protein LOTGIDRAFT_237811 [Lottia gigantea]|uniref:ShKT domain-containing protein n=1 Tax=Lottia gigantea TaxID=225164 RepID=V4B6Q1_LOTGI|nr:hypothetical protein LOTGIDRAFT_237811 [Lottia gigantea]ESP03201.1 hypothetical protein LOTGIDRAFT_237811 [Lottia gigantea]